MGSRIMHYAIATIINNNYQLGNDFLIGSIVPDSNKNSNTPKELTHFMKKRPDGEHDMFPEKFLEEYQDNLDPFKQGYYLHLISDDIWLKTIFKDYILEHNHYDKSTALQLLYADYHYFNQVLIKKYQLSQLTIGNFTTSGVKEIADEDVPEIINDLNADFQDYSDKKSPGLLSLDCIDEYINECVEQFEKMQHS
ncbi:hypothetical protein Q2T76_01915 [Lactobacillus sp. YT155]|uniref:hypothetical protein n=1 Tax=Lactobacillus sp. YT155 TaxID=3060955 RepID=UPI00265F69ED|nr:hypothetical protein [Lactobacillus sp. YT155]MDO1604805.1 hypothetical protein [Lactobacillus sp. YT155]